MADLIPFKIGFLQAFSFFTTCWMVDETMIAGTGIFGRRCFDAFSKKSSGENAAAAPACAPEMYRKKMLDALCVFVLLLLPYFR